MSTLKQGAIVLIRENYNTLVAQNKTYYKGEVIFADTSFGTGLGMKIGTKDPDTQQSGIPFNNLPWFVDPNAPIGGNRPFVVRNYDDNYFFDDTNNQIVITDPKLVGVPDPVVYTTQNNILFRDSDLIIDSSNGILKIKADALGGGLLDGEKIAIFTADGLLPNQVDNESRIAKLEKLTAPLLGGGSIWWNDINNIPDGWVEDVSMRGVIPMAYNPDDPDFDASKFGNKYGSKTSTLTIAQMPAHFHRQGSEALYDFYGNGEANGVGERGWTKPPAGQGIQAYSKQKTSTEGGGQPFSILPPVKIGIWIKFNG